MRSITPSLAAFFVFLTHAIAVGQNPVVRQTAADDTLIARTMLSTAAPRSSRQLWKTWSSVPLEQWTRAKSMDTTIGLGPTPGVWSEPDECLRIEGKADCWDFGIVLRRKDPLNFY